MGKKSQKKYRRKGGFIMKWAEWMESPAYRDLRPPARCLLDEFLLIYRPNRNGRLSISTRRAQELLRVSEGTAMKAFHELVEHGFIALTEGHHWIQGKAREWRLTIEEYNGREPTDDWKKWEPGKPIARLSRKNCRPPKKGQNCINNRGRPHQKRGQSINDGIVVANTPTEIQ